MTRNTREVAPRSASASALARAPMSLGAPDRAAAFEPLLSVDRNSRWPHIPKLPRIGPGLPQSFRDADRI